MDLFTAVHKGFEERLASQRLLARFEEWRSGHEALAVFRDAEAFVKSATERGLDADSVIDNALRDLCIQAAMGATDGRADDDATCLLLALLLEPLDRRSKDPDVAGPLDAEDAQAELVAGVWEAIVSVTPSCSGISKLLINSGRRRVRHAAKRELDYQLHRRRLRLASVDFVEPGIAHYPEQVIELALQDGVLTALEAELIAATRLAPADPSDVASLLGLSERAAFLRRHRAEARLLAWLVGTALPPRFKPQARRVLFDLLGFQGVSDLRGTTSHLPQATDRKEVMRHLGGLLSQQPSRGSDATQPPSVSRT
jgi:hypothetical protein